MTTRNYKRLTDDALLSVAVVDAKEADAVAAVPGGCEGVRYPLFVDLDAAAQAGLEKGAHACIEFILPGRPGRWRAGGEVALALPNGGEGLPPGVCLELLGLALIQDAPPEASGPAGASAGPPEVVEVQGFDPGSVSSSKHQRAQFR